MSTDRHCAMCLAKFSVDAIKGLCDRETMPFRRDCLVRVRGNVAVRAHIRALGVAPGTAMRSDALITKRAIP